MRRDETNGDFTREAICEAGDDDDVKENHKKWKEFVDSLRALAVVVVDH